MPPKRVGSPDPPPDLPPDPLFPIIDSHIHLFPKSHLDSLAWQTPDGPLADQHSVDEYRRAIEQAPLPADGVFKGFVFVEADRKSSLFEEDGGWDAPLEELKFAGRVAQGKPNEGEGHRPEDAKLCRAIVGWAPMPAGRAEVSRYVRQSKNKCGSMMMKLTGLRYLVQDKPLGTMLTPTFIDSLKWLGESGYCFDLGVDCRSGGISQLKEAVEMISRAIEDVPPEKRVVVVISKQIYERPCRTNCDRPHVQTRYEYQ
jgi:L-rhamnono-1,4-lactonase